MIINNKRFPSALGDREGTEVDAAALQELFKYLGFDTKRYNDLSASKMRHTLKMVSETDHKIFDCLLIAILTHGVEGKLYGTDG